MMELLLNPWVTYIGVSLIALCFGIYIGALNSEDDIDEAEELAYEKSVLETEVAKLREEIKEKQNMLYGMQDRVNELVQEHDDLTKGQSFTRVQRDVLDLYDRAGVRLSADILEELYYNRHLTTVAEVKQFIETQRANWKLENSKKI